MQNFRLKVDGEHYNLELPTVFSGGELHLDISFLPENCHDYTLKARCQSSDDIMHMILMASALSNYYRTVTGNIVIPYMPYARQDRVCSKGQHYGLGVVAALLSRVDQRIISYDIHSSVGTFSLSESCRSFKEIQQEEIIANNNTLSCLINSGDVVLVAPDKGAVMKTERVAKKLNSPHFVAHGEKIRDPELGHLSGFDVDVKDFGGKDVLIVDDICDGGGTFLGLAKKLKERNCGSISLYVTHGIFSKGFDIFTGYVDNIYTTDSFRRKSKTTHGQVAQGVQLFTQKL